MELENGVKERLRGLRDKEISRGPVALMEVNVLLAKHKVEELLPLERVKAIEVGKEDLVRLLAIVNQDGPQAMSMFLIQWLLTWWWQTTFGLIPPARPA